MTYSIGLFIEPLQQAFGWTRVQIMAGPSITAFSSFLLAPIVGAQIDRYGARRLALCGAVALSLIFACMGLVGSSTWSWLFVWLLSAVPFAMILPNMWTTAISGFFHAGGAWRWASPCRAPASPHCCCRSIPIF
ncbi:MFS transporter [Sphingobium tyrosinilyticum]|uniref:MFS transporter n=1 Tax=Sphingobium tyrosinilyticum TaxID=2715436 RepID=A0ABV9F179_9SPHN